VKELFIIKEVKVVGGDICVYCEETVAMLDHASEEILTCLTATCHSEMIQR
jgi:hypothetical protein